MNVFVLSVDAQEAARMQCNKHCVKLAVESAQLLSTAHPRESAPYRHTHFNHPCAKWTRESLSNYRWLVLHGLELCLEYTRRYGKIHKTQKIIEWCAEHEPDLPDTLQTPFVVCIKDKRWHIEGDPVQSYRNYYIGEKVKFAKWAPRAKAPDWWPFDEK